VAILFNPADYMVNSNLQVTYRRYFNEETDEWVHKATMIADGKLADPYGVVLSRRLESKQRGAGADAPAPHFNGVVGDGLVR